MTDDDIHTERWERLSPADVDVDVEVDANAAVATGPQHAFRDAIAAVCAKPRDEDTRRRLRALGDDQDAKEQLAALLADAARAADDNPELAIVLWIELADIHESLDQPIEEIAALEMVIEYSPRAIEVHDRLARVYLRAGVWGKAAAAFESVAGLAHDDRGRAALRAAARLYREHGKLDRAADVYREMVDRKPSDVEAWHALEDLLGQLEQWRELAEVRAELAKRAANPVDKAVLLRAQARALEQAGDTATATELVAIAASHAPDEISGLVDYADVLAQGGQGEQAATVLRQRIAEARAQAASADELAALQLHLVAILDEHCGDPAAADAVLDELLADAPDYAPALQRLVARAEQEGEPRAYADAIVRYAAVVTDPIERAAAYADASRHYRNAGELREQVRTLETAVELVAGDAALARELAEARSALAVERALAEEQTGRLDAALDRLSAILGPSPLDVPANLALADVLDRAGRGAEAVAHLRATLAATTGDTLSARLAPLVFRCAHITAGLGDGDEAHRLLHEAHRLDRRDLAITLALGESCFQRRLWREAALHLGSLAEHPHARAHASAVARALVHAGRAEVRALRPANAGKHYQAAVRLDPSCATAWHALGEAARERGELALALDCFEREVAVLADPRERAKRADTVGELARDSGDLERAEHVWTGALDGADATVLTKLLAIQRERGAGRERGETLVRLAALTDPADGKHELLAEAAQAFASDGELGRARELADQLVAMRPLDVAAVTVATEVALAAQDWVHASQWLHRLLDAGVGSDHDPRVAELWRRLGDCERTTGNERAARTSYQRAVTAAPESGGALAARRSLVEIATRSGRPAGESLAALVEAEHRAPDVLAYARELDASGRNDDATAMFELAHALEPSLSSDDEAVRATRPEPFASDVAYGARLDDAEHRALIDDAGEAPLAELLELLVEALPLLCPDPRGALERAGMPDARRLTATSEVAAAATFPQIANALGGEVALLYASARGGDDTRIVLAAPPVIVLGARLLAMRARSRTDAHPFDVELRFRLGHAIELARPRRALAVGDDAETLPRMVAALPYACGRAEAPAVREVRNEGDRLRNALPAQLRRRIADKLAAGAIDTHGYIANCARAADRAGLLACGHVGVAIELAGGLQAASHLVKLAASPHYLATRRALRPRTA